MPKQFSKRNFQLFGDKQLNLRRLSNQNGHHNSYKRLDQKWKYAWSQLHRQKTHKPNNLHNYATAITQIKRKKRDQKMQQSQTSAKQQR